MIYNSDNGVKYLQFGDGDIMFSHAKFHKTTSEGVEVDKDVLIFAQGNKGEVNRVNPIDENGNLSEPFNVQILMEFNNPDTIDILVEHLIFLKKQLIDSQENTESEAK